MVVALLAILGFTVWSFWPLSADSLYERIVRISSTEGPGYAKDDIERFLDRFPDDPRREEVDALRMDVECESLQSRLALRALKSGGEKLEPWEQDLLAAMRKLPKEPHEARQRLEALLAQYGDAAEHTKSVTACLAAARHLLSRMQPPESN
jgi:serine/threonine-protein kinase